LIIQEPRLGVNPLTLFTTILGIKFNSFCKFIYRGLKERIKEEFRGGQGTGSLAIKHTVVSDFSKWRYSYVIVKNRSNPDQVDLNLDYHELGRCLERAWRLDYGWPILCRS
jgi:hypothetical protein